MTVDYCPEESTSKDGSPGLVQGQELIVWLLFDPDNFENGKLTPSAVSKLKKRDGASTARRDHVTAADAQKHIVDSRLSKNATLSFVGAVMAQADEIRSCGSTLKVTRLFCVYDDPDLPNIPGHSTIRFSDLTRDGKFWDPKKGKNNASAVLGDLLLLFEKRGSPLTLAQAFAV